jgi:hypothetical protein
MQKGSLVDVLELLRPYVDGGLIPDPLPWHVIEQAVPRKISQSPADSLSLPEASAKPEIKS